jgi:hypothetical protein
MHEAEHEDRAKINGAGEDPSEAVEDARGYAGGEEADQEVECPADGGGVSYGMASENMFLAGWCGGWCRGNGVILD